MLKCGLLGKKLGHSYSPQIHGMLGSYEYLLYEKREDELEDFVRGGDWRGLNVTIPYKKEVVRFCDSLSDTAAAIGSVNTLTRDASGRIRGDNTDVYGFMSLVKSTGIDVSGKKTLVLGSGGASASVCFVLNQMGASVTVISRSGEDNYGNLDRHADAEVIVNTTPVGMFPNAGVSPLALDGFPKLSGVLDIIYNPARTALLLQAEKRGIKARNGLTMLTAQAKRSSELFTGNAIPDEEIERVTDRLAAEMGNVVLTGMPGSGKTTVAKLLSELTGKEIVDTDDEIVKEAGMSIPGIMKLQGEKGFRDMETKVLSKACARSGIIISTGGGAVLREENRDLMRQNGRVVRILRDTASLSRKGRPLSEGADLSAMVRERDPFYRMAADMEADNNGSAVKTAEAIVKELRL